MNIGRSLKILLVKHDKTQADLAKEFGCTTTTICNHCNSNHVRLEMLEKYAKYFNITVSELIKIGEE